MPQMWVLYARQDVDCWRLLPSSKMEISEMTLLTKDAILNADDVRTKTVFVKEWGGDVTIKSMSAERHAMFEELSKDQTYRDSLAFYAASIIVDEDGKPMFDSIDDIKKLSGKSNTALITILNAGIELNGITSEDLESTAKKS